MPYCFPGRGIARLMQDQGLALLHGRVTHMEEFHMNVLLRSDE